MSDKKISGFEEVENVQPLALASVEKFVHIPVVEETLAVASRLYGKVKNSNSVLKWTLNTAESAMTKAAETVKPVPVCLQGPIKTVDSLLYSGLDYIEHKVPAVSLPPQQIIDNSQQYICETVKPVVKYASVVKDYGKRKLVQYSIISSDGADNKSCSVKDGNLENEPGSSGRASSALALYSPSHSS